MEKNRLETADASTRASIVNGPTLLETELKLTRKAIEDPIDSNPDLKQRGNLLEMAFPASARPASPIYGWVLSEPHGLTHAKP
ncbi:MAG: IS110 family transposase, partial [Methylococcales bacterium]